MRLFIFARAAHGRRHAPKVQERARAAEGHQGMRSKLDPLVPTEWQDYYRAAQSIYRISKVVESRLALNIGRAAPVNVPGGTIVALLVRLIVVSIWLPGRTTLLM